MALTDNLSGKSGQDGNLIQMNCELSPCVCRYIEVIEVCEMLNVRQCHVRWLRINNRGEVSQHPVDPCTRKVGLFCSQCLVFSIYRSKVPPLFWAFCGCQLRAKSRCHWDHQNRKADLSCFILWSNRGCWRCWECGGIRGDCMIGSYHPHSLRVIGLLLGTSLVWKC